MISTPQTVDSAKLEIREMLKLAKYPQARIYATQLLKKYGQDAELFYLRGTACAHRASPEQAEKDLRAAIALKPKCAEYYLALSNLLFNQNNYDAAFYEYIRAKLIAPKDPKVRAFADIIGGSNGKLAKLIEKADSTYNKKAATREMGDELVTLHIIKAKFTWHVGRYGTRIVFYASSARQIDDAKQHLAAANAILLVSDRCRKKREELETLIRISNKRRFDGTAFDWIFIALIFAIGVIGGGWLNHLYAVSSLMALWAFRRPEYQFNQTLPRYRHSEKKRWRDWLDLAYGSYIHADSRIFIGISNEKLREHSGYFLRCLLRTTILPIAVFAGFHKNHSAIHAWGFAVSLITAVILMQM